MQNKELRSLSMSRREFLKTTAAAPTSPHYAGMLSMFGHHTVHAPVTFTIPLSTTLAAMHEGKRLKADAPPDIRIVPERMAAHGALAAKPGVEAKADVLSIVVEAH